MIVFRHVAFEHAAFELRVIRIATTSSGFTPLCGSLPTMLRAMSTTLGMRVMPPTSTSSLISFSESFASKRQSLHRRNRPLKKIIAELSSLARLQLLLNALRPVWHRSRHERQIDFVFLPMTMRSWLSPLLFS